MAKKTKKSVREKPIKKTLFGVESVKKVTPAASKSKSKSKKVTPAASKSSVKKKTPAASKSKPKTKNHQEVIQKKKEPTDPTKAMMEKVLQAGQLAKVKVYQQLLTKISRGEDLKPSEIKNLHRLEKEIEIEARGEASTEGLIMSDEEAGVYLGVSKRTVSWHKTRGNLKQNPDGTFDRKELDRFMEDRGNDGGKTSTLKDLMEKKEAADLRWKLAKAEREEMLNEKLKGELFTKDEIMQGWCSRVSAVTAGLEAFADRMPPLLIGKKRNEMRDIFNDEIWRLRDVFARPGKYCPRCD